MKEIYYVYPVGVPTSFAVIAKKQIEYLKSKYIIKEISKDILPQIINQINGTVILHSAKEVLAELLHSKPDLFSHTATAQMMIAPVDYFTYINQKRGKKIDQYDLIGFDVCDSDKMSQFAVDLINNIKKVAVPSTYCVNVFRNSGVKSKMYWIPHGVDKEWYEKPNVWSSDLKSQITNPQLLQLYDYKKRTEKQILLYWQWYNNIRKGYTEVAEVYKRIQKQRDDVILVVKVGDQYLKLYDLLKDVEYIRIQGWLSDFEKMALYDIADATLLFSRHGAFEINCLESLARGVPCLAHDKGPWVDYENPRFLIKHGQRIKVFDYNVFHEGYGYTIDVEDAVAKINEILDNLDEYKLIAEDHRQTLKEKFVWDKIAEDIVKMIED